MPSSNKSKPQSEEATCFVMMPFAEPIGSYYESVFVPAIKKAGLKPVRGDDSMFSAGHIINQVWTGINSAKILVAELSTQNPNVYYELGLAHALGKPVILVASQEDVIPFDLRHVRVIYYDITDPFWGKELITKMFESLTSMLESPEEAILIPQDC